MEVSQSAWNKGRAQGQKEPLTPAQVGAIKLILANKGRLRDLALFSVALDTLLRASDLLSIRVADVQDASGGIRTSFAIRQKKTGKVLPVEISEATRTTITRWISDSGKVGDDFLFTAAKAGRGKPSKPLTRRHYGHLVKQWAALVGISDPAKFSTHSLRRTRAAYIYGETKNLEAVRRVLGHKSLAATSAYLGIDDAMALDVARKFQL
jgi:integrase